MATVIDSLVVQLGLDRAEFETGRKDAERSLQQTGQNVEKIAKGIEDQGKRAAEFFRHIRNEAIALFAVFTGGYGLTEFIAHTVSMTANLGRMSENAGLAARDMYAWGEAVRKVGGDADTTRGTIFNLAQNLQQFDLTGQGPGAQFVSVMRSIGVAVADANTGKLRDISDILIDLSKWAQTQPRPRANAILTMLGLDQGTINLLLEGEPVVRRYLEMGRQMAPTPAEVARAEAFQRTWATFRTDLDALARDTFLDGFGTDLDDVVKKTDEWMRANGPWLRGALRTSITEFTSDVKLLSDALGGPLRVTEALLGLWVGAKFVEVGRNIGAMIYALSLVPGSGIVAGAALAGALAYLGFRVPEAGGGAQEDRDLRNRTIEEHPEISPTLSAMQFFMSAEGGGWSRAQAAGFVAQIPSEDSTWDPTLTNDSGHTGLFQTSKERQRVLEGRFPNWGPYSTWTRTQQLAGWSWEYSPGGPEAQIGERYREIQDPAVAGRFASQHMERHGLPSEDLSRGERAARLANIPLPPPALPPPPLPPPNVGAGVLGGTTTSNSMSIGNITINTPATDATGIARDLRRELQRRSMVNSVNSGLA